MLRSLTAKQFREWEAYAQIEPFGELRDDYRAASIRQMIFNANVKPEDQRPIKDFLIKWDAEGEEKKQKQTWQMQKAIAHAIVVAYSQPALPLEK